MACQVLIDRRPASDLRAWVRACCACDVTQRVASVQVVIALSESQIIYFELNATGQLLEVEKKEMSDEIASLGIAQVPEGRQRAPFVIVGCYDQTVRVLSLEPGEALKTKATQTVPAIPRSVMLVTATVNGAGATPACSFTAADLARAVAPSNRGVSVPRVVLLGRRDVQVRLWQCLVTGFAGPYATVQLQQPVSASRTAPWPACGCQVKPVPLRCECVATMHAWPACPTSVSERTIPQQPESTESHRSRSVCPWKPQRLKLCSERAAGRVVPYAHAPIHRNVSRSLHRPLAGARLLMRFPCPHQPGIVYSGPHRRWRTWCR